MRFLSRALCALPATMLLAAHCAASDAADAPLSAADATRWFDEGRTAQACEAAARLADGLDVWFLRGRCAALAGRHGEAIEWFERILLEQDAPRTRLELARSQGAAGMADAARVNYRRVLESAPPDPIREWVLHELQALDGAGERTTLGASNSAVVPRLRWYAGVGVVADSNVNAGPRDENVQVFGLPFVLTPGSLAQRDVGLETWAGLDGQTVLARGALSYELQVQGVRQRQATDFNSESLRTHLGYSLVDGPASWQLQVAAHKLRRHDGVGLSGMSAGAQWLRELSPTRALSAQFASGKHRQSDVTGGDGTFNVAGVSMSTRHAGDTETLAGLRRLNDSAQSADRSHTDHTLHGAVLGTAVNLCAACHWSMTTSLTRAHYAAPDALFGVLRRDRQVQLSATLLGPTPAGARSASWQLTLERTVSASTIPLFAFDRTRLTWSREWTH